MKSFSWPAIFITALWALSSSSSVLAQSCKVLDPELQGIYEGACVGGFAYGPAFARGTAQYSGSFSGGKKHGRGVKVWPNGDRYEGEFAEDRKEGFGTYSWGRDGPAAGQAYVGNFRADRRSGAGTYSWPSGERYVGEWIEDEIAGPIDHMLLARARAVQEARAAVAVPGTKVCREVVVGISEKQLIFGTVAANRLDQVQVRIDYPGTIDTLDGVPNATGELVWGSIFVWSPCR